MFDLNIYSIRKIFFLTSVLIYSLFSYPTPKVFSIAELLIISFFFLSFNINYKNLKEFFIEQKILILLISILVIFLLISLNLKNVNQIIRDLASVFFFILPIFFLYFSDSKKNIYFPLILTIGGMLIFYRLLIKYLIYNGSIEYVNLDLNYLFNDCLILFSLNIILFYTFLYTKGFTKLILIIFSTLNWYLVIHFSLTAGSKVYAVGLIYNLLILIIFFLRSNIKKINLIKFLKKNYFFHYLILLIIILNVFFILNPFEYLNSRNEEIKFFLQYIQKNNNFDLFFGLGLGSFFEVSWGDTKILLSYLHIFPLYMFTKIGLLSSLIIFIIWNKLFCIYKFQVNDVLDFIFLNKNNLIMHSSIITILLGATIYTTFKHFSFWLVMAILCLEINKKIYYEDYKSNSN